MDPVIEHPVIRSLSGKLRDTFGENGRLELRAEVSLQPKLIPEDICRAFRNLGWTVSHETVGNSVLFRFSQPPQDFLPHTPQHITATTQLLSRIHRFLEDRQPGSNCSYPLKGAVPYRVADLAAKILRSSGLEVTLIGDAGSRLTELLITLPANPARAHSSKLTE